MSVSKRIFCHRSAAAKPYSPYLCFPTPYLSILCNFILEYRVIERVRISSRNLKLSRIFFSIKSAVKNHIFASKTYIAFAD